MRRIAGIMATLLLGACCSPRLLQSSIYTTDTVIVREVLRDTAISVQADSSLVRALIE